MRLVVLLFAGARVPGDAVGTWGSELVLAVQQWGAGEYLLSTFLVFIQAAMLNRLAIRQSLTGELNLFPGLCYILLTALHPAFTGISSILLANTFVLVALGYLFDALKKERQNETRFLAGLWLAVTALLYTPYIVLVIFGLIAISMLKTIKIKDVFQYMTGYITPFFIGWMLRFIFTSDLNPGIRDMIGELGLPGFEPINQIADIVAFSIIGLILLICLLGYSQIISRKNIHARKKIDIMYALIFFAASMVFFSPALTVQILMTLMIPLALFVAILLRMIRHPAIAESIHFILFVAALLTQALMLV
jgi:hypothetical protein